MSLIFQACFNVPSWSCSASLSLYKLVRWLTLAVRLKHARRWGAGGGMCHKAISKSTVYNFYWPNGCSLSFFKTFYRLDVVLCILLFFFCVSQTKKKRMLTIMSAKTILNAVRSTTAMMMITMTKTFFSRISFSYIRTLSHYFNFHSCFSPPPMWFLLSFFRYFFDCWLLPFNWQKPTKCVNFMYSLIMAVILYVVLISFLFKCYYSFFAFPSSSSSSYLLSLCDSLASSFTHRSHNFFFALCRSIIISTCFL